MVYLILCLINHQLLSTMLSTLNKDNQLSPLIKSNKPIANDTTYCAYNAVFDIVGAYVGNSQQAFIPISTSVFIS